MSWLSLYYHDYSFVKERKKSTGLTVHILIFIFSSKQNTIFKTKYNQDGGSATGSKNVWKLLHHLKKKIHTMNLSFPPISRNNTITHTSHIRQENLIIINYRHIRKQRLSITLQYIILLWNQSLRTLGEFTVKNAKFGSGICI